MVSLAKARKHRDQLKKQQVDSPLLQEASDEQELTEFISSLSTDTRFQAVTLDPMQTELEGLDGRIEVPSNLRELTGSDFDKAKERMAFEAIYNEGVRDGIMKVIGIYLKDNVID